MLGIPRTPVTHQWDLDPHWDPLWAPCRSTHPTFHISKSTFPLPQENHHACIKPSICVAMASNFSIKCVCMQKINSISQRKSFVQHGAPSTRSDRIRSSSPPGSAPVFLLLNKMLFQSFGHELEHKLLLLWNACVSLATYGKQSHLSQNS